MKGNLWRIIIGGVLILFGIFALLNTITGINLTESIIAIIFAAAGLGFLVGLVSSKANWWMAFPGLSLLGIGAVIGIEKYAPSLQGTLSGVIILGSIGVSFLLVYLLMPKAGFWWALIPAGVMFSLVGLIALEPFLIEPVWVFFLGLAVTFGLLAIPPLTGGTRMVWPLFPAGVLAVLGLAFMAGSTGVFDYIWAIGLILVGLYFVILALRPKKS